MKIEMNMWSAATLGLLIIALCVTLLTAIHYRTLAIAIQSGLVEKQNQGQNGTHWEKP